MYFLFDIGGTKSRFALSKDNESFDNPTIVETPDNFSDAISLIEKTFNEIVSGTAIKASAGGIAGVLDERKSILLSSPNLVGWVQKPLKERLGEVFKANTYLENDADFAGLGEAIYGAGRSFNIVAYITVSTGIGGTRIIDGKIDRAVFGFEPGHQYIQKDVDLEDLVSGGAIEEKYQMKAEDIQDEYIWDQLAKDLAYGLHNTIVHWSPDVLVLGGGMMKEGSISINKVEEYLKDIMKIFPNPPQIKSAELGEKSALFGALHYIKQKSL